MPRSEASDKTRIDWWSGPSLRLHLTMIVGLVGSLAAGWFEWTRARAGHEIAWVYTFEWPLFAVMGSYLWWRLLHADIPAARRKPARRTRHTVTIASTDPGLIEWQNYLDRLQAVDPPGGPQDESVPRN